MVYHRDSSGVAFAGCAAFLFSDIAILKAWAGPFSDKMFQSPAQEDTS
jgi:hypothetical protein